MKPRRTGPDPDAIRSMFGQIAGRYDLANTVLSGGIHHLWRKAAVRWSDAKSGDKVLDCATGTGDLAIEFKRQVGTQGQVTGTDFCAEMLVPAPAKAERKGLQIRFERADVMALPYADATFDIASISFGIRNVADPKKALSELARVTKPGGVVLVLEFGQPRASIVAGAYRFYSSKVLPVIGGLVTGNARAYQYLQDSSTAFPCGDEFKAMMMETGLYSKVECRPLTFGIAYLYKGMRPQ